MSSVNPENHPKQEGDGDNAKKRKASIKSSGRKIPKVDPADYSSSDEGANAKSSKGTGNDVADSDSSSLQNSALLGRTRICCTNRSLSGIRKRTNPKV